MPLETTTNIAGLNANWPTGTDPKSQGDDHLRLIKSVLQTTWPVSDGTRITAAVPYLGPAGTAPLPAFAFSASPDTGMFRAGVDSIGFSANGVMELLVGIGGVQVKGVIDVDGGTVLLPAYSFSSDPDTGMYHWGANAIGFATNGVERLAVDNTAIWSTVPFFGPNGGAATPSYAFNGFQNTGMFCQAGPVITFSLAGTTVARIDATNSNANTLQTRAFADARYTAISDARLKHAVGGLGDPWEDIGWLRAVTYEWNETDDWGRPAGPCVGLIAQEVRQILPNAIRDNGQFLSIDTLPVVALLLKAVQDLQARVLDLESA